MNNKKLYIECIDVSLQTFFESFIEHIDAGKYSTLVQLNPGMAESNIFRTDDIIKRIQVIPGLVLIVYESGNRIEITRR